MFRNNFCHKNTVGESKAPLLLQQEKRGSAKYDNWKVLFADLGEITNRYSLGRNGKLLKFLRILISRRFYRPRLNL